MQKEQYSQYDMVLLNSIIEIIHNRTLCGYLSPRPRTRIVGLEDAIKAPQFNTITAHASEILVPVCVSVKTYD
jgi:hypothetical protein